MPFEHSPESKIVATRPLQSPSRHMGVASIADPIPKQANEKHHQSNQDQRPDEGNKERGADVTKSFIVAIPPVLEQQ